MNASVNMLERFMVDNIWNNSAALLNILGVRDPMPRLSTRSPRLDFQNDEEELPVC
jgi:hypothetical protein